MMIDRSVMQKAIPYPAGWMIGLVGAILAATALKTGILAVQAVPFNADEAVVALMARHILQGERPLFFYGQAYMGSLDAYLVAAIFKMFGSQVWGIRFVQILLYAGTLVTTAWLGKSISGKWQVGVMAAWFLAVPTVSMTLYTTVSMGGYGEMLLVGNLILLLTVSLGRDANRQDSRKRSLNWLGLGLLSGMGLWVFGLTLVYSVPAVGYLVGRSIRSKSLASKSARANPVLEKEARSDSPQWESLWLRTGNWGLLLVGVMIGALPWLVFAINKGFSILLVELGGGAIAGVESVNLAGQILRHGLNLGLFGTTVILGLRPSWEIRWLGLPLAPLVLSFWGLVIVYAVKKTIKDYAVRSGFERLLVFTSAERRSGDLVARIYLFTFWCRSFRAIFLAHQRGDVALRSPSGLDLAGEVGECDGTRGLPGDYFQFMGHDPVDWKFTARRDDPDRRSYPD